MYAKVDCCLLGASGGREENALSGKSSKGCFHTPIIVVSGLPLFLPAWWWRGAMIMVPLSCSPMSLEGYKGQKHRNL